MSAPRSLRPDAPPPRDLAAFSDGQVADGSADGQPGAPDEVHIHPDRALPREVGGPEGPEPTRFGDWEKRGRCIDF